MFPVGESPVGQIHGARTPNGSDQQLPQLSIDAEGGHVAIGRRHRRTAAHRCAIFQSTGEGFVLSERGMLESVKLKIDKDCLIVN